MKPIKILQANKILVCEYPNMHSFPHLSMIINLQTNMSYVNLNNHPTFSFPQIVATIPVSQKKKNKSISLANTSLELITPKGHISRSLMTF